MEKQAFYRFKRCKVGDTLIVKEPPTCASHTRAGTRVKIIKKETIYGGRIGMINRDMKFKVGDRVKLNQIGRVRLLAEENEFRNSFWTAGLNGSATVSQTFDEEAVYVRFIAGGYDRWFVLAKCLELTQKILKEETKFSYLM